MTVGKAAALTAGLVGAIALGVAIGPTVQDSWSNATAPTADSAPASRAESTAVKKAQPAPRSTTARARETAPPRKSPGSIQSVTVSMWEPELRERAKDVLNPGAKLEVAAADFDSAEQFMTVAHAARNTQVPFMVLKHRVVSEGQTLADAIRESKPEADVKSEVARARAAAREDLDITS